jgi:hypothetical protein
MLRSGSGETGHPNWQYVATATEASASQDTDRLVHVEASGAEQVVRSIEVTARDADGKTTRAVRKALRRNDPDVVRDHLLAAQQVPSAVASEIILDPEFTAAIDEVYPIPCRSLRQAGRNGAFARNTEALSSGTVSGTVWDTQGAISC